MRGMERMGIAAAVLLAAGMALGADVTRQAARTSPKWITDGIVYQIQPRTFTAEATLKAAATKLPYLKDLGVTIVYLTPVFVMDTDGDRAFWSKRQAETDNPKNPYRIADYNHVDPEFGTDDDLAAFTAEAHRLGLKVLFDLVYFHCGPKAVFLKDHPDWVVRKADGSADCGEWNFPRLNFENRGLRDYLLDNMRRLIADFGADGFRCDVGEKLPIDFWDESREMLEKLSPGRYALVCEGCTAHDQLKAFDADYGWFPCGELKEGMMGSGAFDGIDIAKKVYETYGWHFKCFPRGAKFMNFVENHDIAQNERRARRNARWDKGAQEQALVWIFTQDGLPMLFHGNEFGEAKTFSNFVRQPIDWAQAETDEGRARLAFVKKLIALRRQYPALTSGQGVDGLKPLRVREKGVTAILRRGTNCRDVLVVQNWTDRPVCVHIEPYESLAARELRLDAYGWTVEELATLRPGQPFRDLMVLQREMPVAVFGEADPGAEVRVAFGGQDVGGTADAQGRWRVTLAPMAASASNRTMTVTAKAGALSCTQEIRNVLVGEVWLAGGQSNMEMPMAGAPCYRDRQGGLLAQVERHDDVRIGSAWGTCHEVTNRCGFAWSRMDSPYTIRGTSALAFYYARELNRILKVPVGVLRACCGGTGIDEWTPKTAFAKYPSLKDLANRKIYSHAEWKPEYAKAPVWNYNFQPTIYFNGCIAPIAPYTMRGFIWYQGCSNQNYADRYTDNLRALYDGWSAAFENPELRMDLVQLAPHNNPKIVKLWAAQDEFARDPAYSNRVSRTVINDLGNAAEIHPLDKEVVARRMLMHALKRDYGFKDITADSPEPVAVKVGTNGTLSVTFSNAKWVYYRNRARKIAENGFELAGADGVWKPAVFVNATGRNGWGHEHEGRFPANVVELRADGVAAPVRVRYLANAPWEGGLFSEVDLPAPAFERISTDK